MNVKDIRQANAQMQDVIKTFMEENERLRRAGLDPEEETRRYRELTQRTDKRIEEIRQRYGIPGCPHCKP